MKQGFHFPVQTTLGRVIPKVRLYEQLQARSTLKHAISQQLEKITWAYKLGRETVNLPPHNDVHEIQIFELLLKSADLDPEILKAIDQAIPSPVVFVLRWQQRLRYCACYKRPHQTDPDQSVRSAYFSSDWLPAEQAEAPLPVALNLESLYLQLLQAIAALPQRPHEAPADWISRYEQLQQLQAQQHKLQRQLHKEKQFKHKVTLNRSLKQIQTEIEQLLTETA